MGTRSFQLARLRASQAGSAGSAAGSGRISVSLTRGEASARPSSATSGFTGAGGGPGPPCRSRPHSCTVLIVLIAKLMFQGEPVPELTAKRRQLVLAICCMSLFIVGLDVTIVNVALPTIQQDFHAPLAGLQWIMDAYTLVLASFLMLAGSTADRLGRRRIFRAGLLLFTLGSLLCSLAPGLGWLVAARVLQAVGGSMLNPVAMSIVTNTFTEPRERARAIGVWSAVFGLSMALGPVLGGFLVTEIGWRGIFWVNVPVGLATLVLTGLFVPESRAPRARRFDPVGQSLVVAILACATYAIIEGP